VIEALNCVGVTKKKKRILTVSELDIFIIVLLFKIYIEELKEE